MRDELVELLSLVYARFNAADSRGLGAVLAPTCSVHQLAVIYGVFALGALVDLTLPPYNAESEHYFDLCRAALSALSLFDDTSTATMQALVLVSVFYSHGGPRFSMDGAWSVISLASNLCKSVRSIYIHFDISQVLKLYRWAYVCFLPTRRAKSPQHS